MSSSSVLTLHLHPGHASFKSVYNKEETNGDFLVTGCLRMTKDDIFKVFLFNCVLAKSIENVGLCLLTTRSFKNIKQDHTAKNLRLMNTV